MLVFSVGRFDDPGFFARCTQQTSAAFGHLWRRMVALLRRSTMPEPAALHANAVRIRHRPDGAGHIEKALSLLNQRRPAPCLKRTARQRPAVVSCACFRSCVLPQQQAVAVGASLQGARLPA